MFVISPYASYPQGIWIGMNVGIAVQTLVMSYMAWRTDWDHQVMLAADRLQCWALKSSDQNVD